jgi:two-component system, NtrC family, response regulator HydG
MSTSTFAACVDDGRFAAEEPRTGPISGVLSKPSALWTGPSTGRGRRASARPRAVEKPSAVDGRAPRKAAVVSPAMRQVFELLQPLARAEVSVTLIGETGTGKDVLARIIHQHSPRAEGPFVVFDCGAVAANLAESELLGHERGAFTGALAAHEGAFERADGGTLFLDEIGELPLDLQTRLLRVLGNRCVRRVGGTVDRPVDVRIVAATNRDLQTEVNAGRFRQDLYFRLAAAVIQVPALRDRPEDMPMLVARLLEDLGHREVDVTPAALALLCSRSWPGNVRELKNTLACAVAFLDGQTLEPRHLALPSASEGKPTLDHLPLGGLRLDAIERVAIQQTLRQTGGNKVRAAQLLGIAPSTLYEKLKKGQRASASDAHDAV